MSELGTIPDKLPDTYLPASAHQDSSADHHGDPRAIFWMHKKRNDFNQLIAELSFKLPEVNWLKDVADVFSWGNEDTNDLTLSFGDDKCVESFGCRIDLRELDEDFISLVLEICTSRNYLLSDRKGNIKIPSRHELGKLLAKSNAANFVADPKKFLRDSGLDKSK